MWILRRNTDVGVTVKVLDTLGTELRQTRNSIPKMRLISYEVTFIFSFLDRYSYVKYWLTPMIERTVVKSFKISVNKVVSLSHDFQWWRDFLLNSLTFWRGYSLQWTPSSSLLNWRLLFRQPMIRVNEYSCRDFQWRPLKWSQMSCPSGPPSWGLFEWWWRGRPKKTNWVLIPKRYVHSIYKVYQFPLWDVSKI